MNIRDWLNRFWGHIDPDPIDRVETNLTGLVVHIDNHSFTIDWDKIRTISIQHISGSPKPEKTHYLFSLPERNLRISLSTLGMNEFVNRLQKAPGLKNRDYAAAISQHNEFAVPIWKNPKYKREM